MNNQRDNKLLKTKDRKPPLKTCNKCGLYATSDKDELVDECFGICESIQKQGIFPYE
jgi:hypothetical protein